MTNNSTKSRAGYLGKFTGLGLSVKAVRRMGVCVCGCVGVGGGGLLGECGGGG